MRRPPPGPRGRGRGATELEGGGTSGERPPAPADFGRAGQRGVGRGDRGHVQGGNHRGVPVRRRARGMRNDQLEYESASVMPTRDMADSSS